MLGRRLAVCIEDFTRDLELLDSLSLAESVDTIKSRRKNIVVKIQVDNSEVPYFLMMRQLC